LAHRNAIVQVHDSAGVRLPTWLPRATKHYIEHTVSGLSFRALARRHGCHPSTVLRQVRHIENQRDDPLVDEALDILSRQTRAVIKPSKDFHSMTTSVATPSSVNDTEINREARRILRRLCESTAFLIVGKDMEQAVVMRARSDNGKATRTAVVGRHIVHAFVLRDWISCFRKRKVSSYEITAAGRAALKRLLHEDAQRGQNSDGFGEAPSKFQMQHCEWGERQVASTDASSVKSHRFNLAESPLTALGRRKDKTGKPFLSAALIAAGDRLREDFELAQMGPRVTQNWERFLTMGRTGSGSGDGIAAGPSDARTRVSEALSELGPGLGDIALRCCCYIEGLETAEKRMGWSARSGKIVLRIALTRLRRHYETRHGSGSPMIG